MESPFMTLAEAASYCRFDDCDDPIGAFRKWARRHHVTLSGEGRRQLVEKRLVYAAYPTVEDRVSVPHLRSVAGGRR